MWEAPTASAFEGRLSQVLNAAFPSDWTVLPLFSEGDGALSGGSGLPRPRLAFIRSKILFVHEGLGVLEGRPGVGPVSFHAETLGFDACELQVGDEMMVIATFDEARGTFATELVVEHKKRTGTRSECTFALSGGQASAASDGVPFPGNGTVKSAPDLHSDSDSLFRRFRCKVAKVANKCAFLQTEDNQQVYLSRQQAGDALQRLTEGDTVEAVVQWNEDHTKWQVEELVSHTPASQNATTNLVDESLGSKNSLWDFQTELEGWTILDCLLAHIAMRGGRMLQHDIGALYDSYPPAARVINVCGGLQNFCAQNAEFVKLEGAGSGLELCQLGEGNKTSSVLKCLLALIDHHDGRLDNNKIGQLYQLHPEARSIVRQAGGLNDFCRAHQEVVFQGANGGPSSVMRSGRNAERPSQQHPEHCDAVLALIDSQGGSLPISMLHLLSTQHPAAFRALKDAPDARTFLAPFMSRISQVFDNRAGMLVLRRTAATAVKASFTLGDRMPQLKSSAPEHGREPEHVIRVQGLVNRINPELGAFITKSGSHPVMFLSREVAGSLFEFLEVGDNVVAIAKWEPAHLKWQAVKLISVTSANGTTRAASAREDEVKAEEEARSLQEGEDRGSTDSTAEQGEGESELKGWTVLDCLLAHLSMRGGQMRTGDMGTLYESYPAAARIIRASGGLSSFCLQHASAVAVCDGMVLRLPPEWPETPEETVLSCLLALVDAAGGSFPVSRSGVLYKYHPEAKKVINGAGGLQKFCLRFRHLVCVQVPETGSPLLTRRAPGWASLRGTEASGA